MRAGMHVENPKGTGDDATKGAEQSPDQSVPPVPVTEASLPPPPENCPAPPQTLE
jgi:hypothetical protein